MAFLWVLESVGSQQQAVSGSWASAAEAQVEPAEHYCPDKHIRNRCYSPILWGNVV